MSRIPYLPEARLLKEFPSWGGAGLQSSAIRREGEERNVRLGMQILNSNRRKSDMKKIATLVAGAAVAAIAFTSPAQAHFVLADNVFADLGATGFGNAPRLLTLQNDALQSGAVISQAGHRRFSRPSPLTPPSTSSACLQ